MKVITGIHRFGKPVLLNEIYYDYLLAMSRLQARYDKLADRVKDLQDQKRRIEGDAIMDEYLKSRKSFDEIMTFLIP